MTQIQPHGSIIDNVNFGEPTGNRPVTIQGVYLTGNKKSQKYDFSYLYDNQGIGNIQTIFIDNYLNDSDLIYENLDNGQIIVCKKNTQGYYPLLASKKLKFNLKSNTDLNLKINFYLTNFIISHGAW